MKIIFFGMMFLMSIQPIMMVVMLIIVSLLYSMYLYMMMGSYWFSYALILVMLSGVLVVFSYMVSLIPNESFEMYGVILIIISISIFLESMYFVYGMDMSFVCFNLWNSYIGNLNLFLMMILFSIMVLVVWLSCLSEGAVRVS